MHFASDPVEEVLPVLAADEYDRTPASDILANKMAKRRGDFQEEMTEVCVKHLSTSQ